MNARLLQEGALVTTDFSGRITLHRIVGKKAARNCQSGILFQVEPEVPKSGGPDAWLDADWFARHDGAAQQGRLF